MTAKTRFTFMVYGAGGYDRKKYVEDIYKGVKADMFAIFDNDENFSSFELKYFSLGLIKNLINKLGIEMVI